MNATWNDSDESESRSDEEIANFYLVTYKEIEISDEAPFSLG